MMLSPSIIVFIPLSFDRNPFHYLADRPSIQSLIRACEVESAKSRSVCLAQVFIMNVGLNCNRNEAIKLHARRRRLLGVGLAEQSMKWCCFVNNSRTCVNYSAIFQAASREQPERRRRHHHTHGLATNIKYRVCAARVRCRRLADVSCGCWARRDDIEPAAAGTENDEEEVHAKSSSCLLPLDNMAKPC